MIDVLGVIITAVSVLLIVALVMCWCLIAIAARSEREADRTIADWSKRRNRE